MNTYRAVELIFLTVLFVILELVLIMRDHQSFLDHIQCHIMIDIYMNYILQKEAMNEVIV